MIIRTGIALLIAPLATAGLVLLTAYFDRGRSFIDSLRRVRVEEGESGRSTAYGIALITLGVGAGIPAALGLMPSGPLVLLGSLVACVTGRRLIKPHQGFLDVAWTTVIAWCIAAALLRFKTLDPAQGLAAQAAVGPSTLVGPALLVASSSLALLVGLASVALWCRSLSSSPNGPDGPDGTSLSRVLGWGESTLAAVAVSATVWGPSLGALVYGPLSSWPWVATSVAITVGALAGVCLLSKALSGRRGRSWVSYLSAILPVAASLAVFFAGVGS